MSSISQEEADFLFGLEKVKLDDRAWDFPQVGEKIIVPLVSKDRKESFNLDVSRGRIDLSKITYQNRARTNIILARIDLAGAPHKNPDGSEIGCPHIHRYHEGYGDKWAYEINSDTFKDVNDHYQVLVDFMDFCNVTDRPTIDKGMFA